MTFRTTLFNTPPLEDFDSLAKFWLLADYIQSQTITDKIMEESRPVLHCTDLLGLTLLNTALEVCGVFGR